LNSIFSLSFCCYIRWWYGQRKHPHSMQRIGTPYGSTNTWITDLWRNHERGVISPRWLWRHQIWSINLTLNIGIVQGVVTRVYVFLRKNVNMLMFFGLVSETLENKLCTVLLNLSGKVAYYKAMSLIWKIIA
jgi:hypothetical protein